MTVVRLGLPATVVVVVAVLVSCTHELVDRTRTAQSRDILSACLSRVVGLWSLS